jgi:phosphomevalonate kinase
LKNRNNNSKGISAILAKILGKVNSIYYALSLQECAPDQSAIGVGFFIGSSTYNSIRLCRLDIILDLKSV